MARPKVTGNSAPPKRYVIAPGRRMRSLDVPELWRYRGLLGAMTRRDLTLRYRQTLLGPIWIVLQPLLGAAIFAFVFGAIIKLKSNGVPYFLFAYSGLLAWTPFSSTLMGATTSFVTNINLVSKVYFPRLMLPLAQLGSKVVDFGVSLVVFVVAALLYGLPITWRMATIPIWMTLALLLPLGPGLILGTLNVTYRDIGAIVPVTVPMLLYLSPIAYTSTVVPGKERLFYDVNPMVGLVDAFRWSLLGRTQLDAGQVGYTCAFAVVAVVIGAYYLRHREKRFADDI